MARLGLVRFKPEEEPLLTDPKNVFANFLECLKDGDHESALDILLAGLSLANKSAFLRRNHISPRSFYNMYLGKNVPTLATVAKLCKALQHEADLLSKEKR